MVVSVKDFEKIENVLASKCAGLKLVKAPTGRVGQYLQMKKNRTFGNDVWSEIVTVYPVAKLLHINPNYAVVDIDGLEITINL